MSAVVPAAAEITEGRCVGHNAFNALSCPSDKQSQWGSGKFTTNIAKLATMADIERTEKKKRTQEQMTMFELEDNQDQVSKYSKLLQSPEAAGLVFRFRFRCRSRWRCRCRYSGRCKSLQVSWNVWAKAVLQELFLYCTSTVTDGRHQPKITSGAGQTHKIPGGWRKRITG